MLIYNEGSLRWESVEFEQKVESTRHKMGEMISFNKFIGNLNASYLTVPTGIIASSGALSLSTEANIVDINLTAIPAITKCSAIAKGDYIEGTYLQICFTGSRGFSFVTNTTVTNPLYLPIKYAGMDPVVTVDQEIGTTWTFLRHETYWELIPLYQKARKGSWLTQFRTSIILNSSLVKSTITGGPSAPAGLTIAVIKNEFGECRFSAGRLGVLANITTSALLFTVPVNFLPTNYNGSDPTVLFACPARSATADTQRMVFLSMNADTGAVNLVGEASNHLNIGDVVDMRAFTWLCDFLDS
jgi:hypothetical protein